MPLAWRPALVAALAGAAVFANSLHGGFVMDDTVAVKTNMDLRPETPLADLWTHDFWGTPLHWDRSHKSYRPLTVLTFRWSYALGGLEPFQYHLGNVLAHASCCFLATLAAARVLRSQQQALAAGLLFATHPAHTEAVAGVVGRAETVSGLFFFASFLAHPTFAGRVGWPRLLLAHALAVAATLSKETGITVLGVSLVYDLAVARSSAWAKRGACNAAVAAGLLQLRVAMTGGTFGPTFSFVDNYIHYAPTQLSRALSYAYLHWRYALIALWPQDLSCDWSFEAFPLLHSLDDARVLLPLALYGAALALVVEGVRRRSAPLLAALAFAVLPFVPSSGLFFPVATVLGERLLYLPVFGLCLLLAAAKAPRPVLVAVVAAYAARTWRRNLDWRDPVSLFSAAAATVPSSCKAHMCLGAAYLELGRHEEALAALRRSLEAYPDYASAHYVMGNAYDQLGDTQRALDAYLLAGDKAQEDAFLPDVFAVAYNNVGSILIKARQYEEALPYLAQAIEADPIRYSALANMGEAHHKLGRLPEAKRFFDRALEQREEAEVLNNLGIVEYRLAVDEGRHRSDRVLRAVAERYRRAIEVDPDFFEARENLLKLHEHWGEWKDAWRQLRQMSRLRPTDKGLQRRIREVGDLAHPD